MAIVKSKCLTCGKTAKERDSFLGMITLECGHLLYEDQVKEASPLTYEAITSTDGKKPRSYQIETCRKAEQANFRLGIFHEPGVGKTLCALMPLKIHGDALLPAIIVTKAAVVLQHFHEVNRWIVDHNSQDEDDFGLIPQIISSSKEVPSSLFKIIIISYDLVPKLLDKLIAWKPKTVILDEVQNIKNPDIKRTKACRKLVENCQHVLPLSGTPILNHATEYFVCLNILAPRIFYSQIDFVRNWTTSSFENRTGKMTPGRIKEWRVKEFHELIKPFTIRFTTDQVAPDLPKINKMFKLFELGDQVEKEYNHVLTTMKSYMDEENIDEDHMNSQQSACILAFINKMSHIVGNAKAENLVETVLDEFIEGNEGKKIVVFHHHQTAGDILESSIEHKIANSDDDSEWKSIKSLRLTASDSPEQRDEKIKEFWSNPNARILIARTLAEGEGLNLQCADHSILLEAEWNPPKETQACVGRLRRVGSEFKTINVLYTIALGTIDEWRRELVERKAEILSETMGDEVLSFEDNEIMKGIVSALLNGGKSRWSLPR